MASTIHELVDQVREYIQERRLHRPVFLHGHIEHVLAALDAIRDTEHAIDEFLFSTRGGKWSYLKLYGVLQAVVIQQDSANALRVGLRMCHTQPKNLPDAMRRVRELRNRAVGHPTDLNESPTDRVATMVTLRSLVQGALEIWKLNPGGRSVQETYDLVRMLEDNRGALFAWIAELVQHLESLEQERRKHLSASGPLVGLLGPNWRYLVRRLHEAANRPHDRLPVSEVDARELRRHVKHALRKGHQLGIKPLDQEYTRTLLRALVRMEGICRMSRCATGMKKLALDAAAYAELIDRHMNGVHSWLKSVDDRLKENGA